MPSAQLIDITCLPTYGGWITPWSDCADLQVLGLDRQGQLCERDVRIERRGETTPSGYLGTTSAFGAFSEETKVLQSNGEPVRLGRLIASGDVRDRLFESIGGGRYDTASSTACNSLWQSLLCAAAISDGESIVLRSRNGECRTDNERRLGKRVECGSHEYCVLHRKAFDSSMTDDWKGTVAALVHQLLDRDETGTLYCERAMYPLVLWYADAMRAEGRRARLVFDTIQHSAIVGIDVTSEDVDPVAHGGCAFLTPHAATRIKLEWADPSWIPVASGFLLAPE